MCEASCGKYDSAQALDYGKAVLNISAACTAEFQILTTDRVSQIFGASTKEWTPVCMPR
jgi:hypothetical protein